MKRLNDRGELVEVASPSRSRSKTEERQTSALPKYVPMSAPMYRPFPEQEPPPPPVIDLDGASGPLVDVLMRELLGVELGHRRRELAGKYARGGKISVVDTENKIRTVPARTFFAWLERLAQSLDALEEALDTHPKLYEESEELLAQLRRMRGSWTTFNVLFADRHDHFSGKF
ncbi:MAG: hypothetical protein KTR25_12995 [Myxococcales bacterium]|nr:hypothetical protein [Myxococcales bacterium]